MLCMINILPFFLIKQLRNCLPHENVLVVLINNTIYFVVCFRDFKSGITQLLADHFLSPVTLEIERRLKKILFVRLSIFKQGSQNLSQKTILKSKDESSHCKR